MNNMHAVTKRIAWGMVLLLLAGLMAVVKVAAEQPLTKDDITLLLLGGATNEKIIALVEQRGIDFQLNPDLAKKFHDSGASDELIEALQKASKKAQASAPAAVAPAPQPNPSAAAAPAAATAPTAAAPGAQPASAPATARKGGGGLGDPSPDQVQGVIQEFAAKEKLFKTARDNYTYHQVNKVQELGADDEVVGVYQQEWDILYDDSGNRIERVTYAPVDTLKRIGVTKEDLDSMRNIQPFVLTSDELPEYDIKYLGHVKVDEITAYVFSIRPKEIKKGHQYFQGTVWVDDRDLQIVKTEGKTVPEFKTKKGENLFPRFTTYREQIDGKYWFPTYTMADDTLYFSSGPVHIKQVIRYAEYKQFKSKVRILSATPTDQPNAPPATAPPKKK
jgi:hypothetical protein